MQAQDTLIIWSYEVPYLAKVFRENGHTIYHIDRADDDFTGTYADDTKIWNFPTDVVDELGGDKEQLQRLLNTLAPTKYASSAHQVPNAA
ncbi:MAG: hypothetical protein HQL35_09155 [Alphaproteobacteria bacterium]|nr:hypothetical protein [Alphaproteobacteria bacterium]